MLLLEKIVGIARGAAKQALTPEPGNVLRIFIANNTGEPLVREGEPHVAGVSAGARAQVSFASLAAECVGSLTCDGASDHGFAMKLDIGGAKCFLGAKSSRTGLVAFASEICPPLGTSGRSVRDFYTQSVRDRSGCLNIEGSSLFVQMEHVVQGFDTVVHILVGRQGPAHGMSEECRELLSGCCLAGKSVDHSRMLGMVESCRREDAALLARLLYAAELMALQGTVHRLDLHDQVFAMDVLITGFIVHDLVGLGRSTVDQDMRAWCEGVPAVLCGEFSQTKSSMMPEYARYKQLATVADGSVEQHAMRATLLLKTVALRCALAVNKRVLNRQEATRLSMPNWGLAADGGDLENLAVMVQHLSLRGAPRSPSAAFTADESETVMRAAQQSIHETATFTKRRGQCFDALEANTKREAALEALRLYRACVPPFRRSFGSPGSGDTGGSGAEVIQHEAWAPELFAGLGTEGLCSPEAVLESLGHGSPPYVVMATNSKSGEFFCFSGDRRFLIKTVSDDEANVLFRMLPAYQAHHRAVPRSLIVRYAGMHSVHIPNMGLKYFTVMASVFDPDCKVHETFDVKGSLLNRRMKPGESIGKDEDWVGSGRRLQLPAALRREVRAVHEQDAAFLASFGVMDYSLLIGIHHVGHALSSDCRPDGQPGHGWRKACCGLRSTDGDDIYFVGLIDFLIAFGLYKQAEHVLHVAKGTAEIASCVDPETFATRQVRFVQDKVLAALPPARAAPREPCKYGAQCYRKNASHKAQMSHPGDDDWGDPEDKHGAGTQGVLRVLVKSAKDLRNADSFGDISDPYVVASLGLQRARTLTIQNNLNPSWNCLLRLAVDEAHLGSRVVFDVWDEDYVRSLQGSDDHLGRLTVPLLDAIQAEGPLDISRDLEDAQGTLNLQLSFEPTASFMRSAHWL